MLAPLVHSGIYNNCEIYGTCEPVKETTIINQTTPGGGGGGSNQSLNYFPINETLVITDGNHVVLEDNDTTYTAGSNLTLTGTEFSLDETSVFSWLSNFFVSISNYWTTDQNDELNTTGDPQFHSVSLSGLNSYLEVYDSVGQNAIFSVGRDTNQNIELTADDTDSFLTVNQDGDEENDHDFIFNTDGDQNHSLFEWIFKINDLNKLRVTNESIIADGGIGFISSSDSYNKIGSLHMVDDDNFPYSGFEGLYLRADENHLSIPNLRNLFLGSYNDAKQDAGIEINSPNLGAGSNVSLLVDEINEFYVDGSGSYANGDLYENNDHRVCTAQNGFCNQTSGGFTTDQNNELNTTGNPIFDELNISTTGNLANINFFVDSASGVFQYVKSLDIFNFADVTAVVVPELTATGNATSLIDFCIVSGNCLSNQFSKTEYWTNATQEFRGLNNNTFTSLIFANAGIRLGGTLNANNQDITNGGDITANNFIGDGSQLTGLTESQITDLQHINDTTNNNYQKNSLNGDGYLTIGGGLNGVNIGSNVYCKNGGSVLSMNMDGQASGSIGAYDVWDFRIRINNTPQTMGMTMNLTAGGFYNHTFTDYGNITFTNADSIQVYGDRTGSSVNIQTVNVNVVTGCHDE